MSYRELAELGRSYLRQENMERRQLKVEISKLENATKHFAEDLQDYVLIGGDRLLWNGLDLRIDLGPTTIPALGSGREAEVLVVLPELIAELLRQAQKLVSP